MGCLVIGTFSDGMFSDGTGWDPHFVCYQLADPAVT